MQVLPSWGVELAPMTELPPNTRWASIRERLEEQRRDKGLRQDEIGLRVNPPIKQQTVSKYERDLGSLKERGPDFVTEFFQAYEFTEAEVVELLGALFSSLTNLLTGRYSTDLVVVANGTYINVYAAGTGPAWGDDQVLERLYIPGLNGEEGEFIGLKATGDSMAPYLKRGETAIIRRDDGLVNDGDYCAVWLADDGCVIKRLVRELDNGVLLLESLNPPPGEDRYFEAPLGSRVLGKVVRRVTDG